MELCQFFANLNLFESGSVDPDTIRQEKISTRVFLVVFVLSIIGLALYAALSLRTVTVIKENPSESEFQWLYPRYTETIKCPCSSVAIPYGEFIQYDATFHEVCSSQFLSQTWIDAVYVDNRTFLLPNDVRNTLSIFWQSIQLLCTLTQKTMVNVLDDFNSSLLLSSQAQPFWLLEINAKTALQFSFVSAIAVLKRSLLISQQSIVTNHFISGSGTNFQFDFVIYNDGYTKTIVPVTNSFPDNCSCWELDGCSRPAVISEQYETVIPGMVFNCQPFTGVLASSLECFYQPWCMALLQQSLLINMTSMPLLIAKSSFERTAIIETLLEELMIEEWRNVTSFQSYYDYCNPTQCTYSYSKRINIAFVVTFIIGAFGGLSFLLNFSIPLLIKFVFWIYRRSKQPRPALNRDESTHAPWRHRIKVQLASWYSILWNSLVNLNLYKSPSRDPQKIHRQRMTTRIFIASLIVALVIMSIYILISVQTKTILIPNPSQSDYEQLYNNHSSTLRCVCSQPVISYSDFLTTNPNFHQLCSSEFISPTWYNRLLFTDQQNLQFSYDAWLKIGSAYFQLLASFCFLAQSTINDAYRIFSANEFVNSVVLPKTLFLQQIQIAIDTYTQSTYAEFRQSISLVHSNIYVNQFITATLSNVMFDVQSFDIIMSEGALSIPNPDHPGAYSSVCLCISEGTQCAFYAYFINSSMNSDRIWEESLFIRCFPTDSVLTSTLECWYDQACLTLVRTSYAFYGVTDLLDILPLNTNVISRFPVNTPTSTLVNELFLENWTTTASYEQFFEGCAPASCSYTIEQRFDFIYVVFTTLSVYSGLIKGLRLISPLTVGLVLIIIQKYRTRKRAMAQPTTTVASSPPEGLNLPMMAKFRQHLSRINLFETYTSSAETLRHELLSTRVYVVVLTVCIGILVFYTGIAGRSESRTISKPSESIYDSLESHYSDTLQCPCVKISITQSEFISSLNAVLHPVCSSDLISDNWYTYLNGRPGWDPPELFPNDFRRWGLLFFNLLASFCSMANSTVTDATEQFQSRTFVSAQVLSSHTFQTQINSEIRQFQTATANTFSHILDPMRVVSQSNALISVLGTSWLPKLTYNSPNASVFLEPIVYDNGSCSCATSSLCLQSAALFYWNGTQFYTVDSIFYGCTPLESIFLSTLRCFFSNSCLTEFLQAVPLGTYENFWNDQIFPMAPLVFSSVNSTFRENDTIQTMVNRLFIDSWSSEISYERYYNACAPPQCIYTFQQRLDIVYVITTFLSVYSGLSIVLRFLIPRIIIAFHRLKMYCIQHRVRPS